ncbi:hypothetical protein [Rosistilla oblonga]|uniref:hypothetical protein n=1 Tax=Rosistilla oblonga TaxID=2527990 RepID=UPI0011A06506
MQSSALSHQAFPIRRHLTELFRIGNSILHLVVNSKPRKMRFGLSEGMVTAAGPGGAEVFVLGVDEGALPGQRVH